MSNLCSSTNFDITSSGTKTFWEVHKWRLALSSVIPKYFYQDVWNLHNHGLATSQNIMVMLEVMNESMYNLKVGGGCKGHFGI